MTVKNLKSVYYLSIVFALMTMLGSCTKKGTDSVQSYSLKVIKSGKGSIAATWSGGSATDVQLSEGMAIPAGKQVTLTATAEATGADIVWNGTEHSPTYAITMGIDETISVAFVGGSDNGGTSLVNTIWKITTTNVTDTGTYSFTTELKFLSASTLKISTYQYTNGAQTGADISDYPYTYTVSTGKGTVSTPVDEGSTVTFSISGSQLTLTVQYTGGIFSNVYTKQ